MWKETVTTGKSAEHKWETVATRRPVICSKSQITSKLSTPVSLEEVAREMKPSLRDQQTPQKKDPRREKGGEGEGRGEKEE